MKAEQLYCWTSILCFLAAIVLLQEVYASID